VGTRHCRPILTLVAQTGARSRTTS
jgi:hypothetical protein